MLTERSRRTIAGAIAEIDLAQMEILRKQTPAQRTRQAASMIAAAEQVMVYRLLQREPNLTPTDATQIVRRGLTDYIREQHTQ